MFYLNGWHKILIQSFLNHLATSQHCVTFFSLNCTKTEKNVFQPAWLIFGWKCNVRFQSWINVTLSTLFQHWENKVDAGVDAMLKCQLNINKMVYSFKFLKSCIINRRKYIEYRSFGLGTSFTILFAHWN